MSFAGSGMKPDRSTGSPVSADRVDISTSRLAMVTTMTAIAIGMAVLLVPGEGRDPGLSFLGGAMAASLGVLALRSVALRTVVRGLIALSAVIALFFGEVNTGYATSANVLGWIAAGSAALVLAAAGKSTSRSANVAGAAVSVTALAAAMALLIGPALSQSFSQTASDGRPGDFGRTGEGSALVASSRLDMTRRPRLSDAIVMTVAANRPSFWRAQTFEKWDGSAWTVADTTPIPLNRAGRVTADEFDIAADRGVELRQDIRVAGSFATALPAAPSAVQVDVTGEGYQLEDGSLLSIDPLGQGARYSVVSRQMPVTEALLRAAPAVSADARVAGRFGADPVATKRVVKLAAEITAGTTTPYDKVLAIERWMGNNTTYSLDAPLSPSGVDVVDHFLFTAKQGWCEQIASSLVVLARLNGLPARLASGYVTGEFDSVSGRYQVRERDAHAWAEVWFEGLGWVPFDPTAEVPLAGDAAANANSSSWLLRYGGWVLLITGLLLAFGLPLARGLPSLGRRLIRTLRSLFGARRREVQGPERVEADLEARIGRVGEMWGRPRSDAETATAYSLDLSERTGVRELEVVGTLVDRSRYARIPVAPEELAGAIAVLDGVALPSESKPGPE